jgi:hypothetical protein
MDRLLAFHGEQGIKDQYLARVMLHRQADRLIQGTGWTKGNDGVFRGCAVGCCLESYDHSQYPIELGIPQVLAHLEDRIFERLPKKQAMLWPERFLDAAQPGADLSCVWPAFAAWLLLDSKHGAIRFAQTAEQRAVISETGTLCRNSVPIGDPRWANARRKAWDVRHRAAAYTATAAIEAAAYTATAAIEAAAYTATAATYATAATDVAAEAVSVAVFAFASASADARKKHWKRCADKLVELMAAAPVVWTAPVVDADVTATNESKGA